MIPQGIYCKNKDIICKYLVTQKMSRSSIQTNYCIFYNASLESFQTGTVEKCWRCKRNEYK